MNLTNNTILITGGSSGIGLEITRKLAKTNKILICGRDIQKLENTKKIIPEIDFFQCDLSQTEACHQLANWVEQTHPDCNVLINNAAIVHVSDFYSNSNILAEARTEIESNLMAPIVLSKLLLPILEKNAGARIMNITTGLVYAPKANYPFYNATKAAMHSFTQVLRKQLEKTSIKVIEVMFPAVDTPWHKGNAPKIAISVEDAVNAMLKGLQKDKDEVRIAGVKKLYILSRVAPKFAFRLINNLTTI